MVIHGDCIEVLKTLPDNSVDSCVTDPPYELGFMGKSWDNTGIANNKEMWGEVMRVIKPGGHLLAFSGTRTYHRMAVAIEDAGFEVRDMIEWVYGSGFPKSLNIGKAVDKLQGNEREVVGEHPYANRGTAQSKQAVNLSGSPERSQFLDKGTSEWEGWGTALKPAHEPICMARKPLAEKTVAENVLKYGTGGINIDESRVGIREKEQFTGKKEGSINAYGDYFYEKSTVPLPSGRFPANLIHDNSEEVRGCFPDAKGMSTQNSSTDLNVYTGNSLYHSSTKFPPVRQGFNDSGNASRFFKSIIYQAKASKSERNKGCEELEVKQTQGGGGGIGDYENDVNSMSGKYGSEKAPAKNNHPTVKPIALMEYLIKMVTPKGGTVLDPFMGSGSTGVAAKQNGYDFIGIDMTPEYVEIAKARMEAVIQQPQLYGQPE